MADYSCTPAILTTTGTIATEDDANAPVASIIGESFSRIMVCGFAVYVPELSDDVQRSAEETERHAASSAWVPSLLECMEDMAGVAGLALCFDGSAWVTSLDRATVRADSFDALCLVIAQDALELY